MYNIFVQKTYFFFLKNKRVKLIYIWGTVKVFQDKMRKYKENLFVNKEIFISKNIYGLKH
jgi:hypothetical protein